MSKFDELERRSVNSLDSNDYPVDKFARTLKLPAQGDSMLKRLFLVGFAGSVCLITSATALAT